MTKTSINHKERDTFISFRGFLWFWISLSAVLLSCIFYYLDESVGGRNGGTVLGYTLGTISTTAILYLMWYGIRKRSYYSKMTTLKAVLSSHIWIGIALVFIVPLHAGFSFHFNIHTMAYVLMLLTIATGVWGVVIFRRYPYALSSQRGGGTIAQLAAGIFNIAEDIKNLEAGKGKGRSNEFIRIVHELKLPETKSIVMRILSLGNEAKGNDAKIIDEEKMANIIQALPSEEQGDAISLVLAYNKKISLETKIKQETRALFLLKAWLYLHIPLSFSLCAALFIHIFSVFYYW